MCKIMRLPFLITLCSVALSFNLGFGSLCLLQRGISDYGHCYLRRSRGGTRIMSRAPSAFKRAAEKDSTDLKSRTRSSWSKIEAFRSASDASYFTLHVQTLIRSWGNKVTGRDERSDAFRYCAQ